MHIPTVSSAHIKRNFITGSAEQEDHCHISAFSLNSKMNKSGISRKLKILGGGGNFQINSKAKLFKCFNN